MSKRFTSHLVVDSNNDGHPNECICLFNESDINLYRIEYTCGYPEDCCAGYERCAERKKRNDLAAQWRNVNVYKEAQPK